MKFRVWGLKDKLPTVWYVPPEDASQAIAMFTQQTATGVIRGFIGPSEDSNNDVLQPEAKQPGS